MGEERKDPMRECELIDLYIKKDKLYVVTNTSMHKEQPQLHRTIVHFIANEVEEYLTGKEKLILYDKITFNQNKDRIEILLVSY